MGYRRKKQEGLEKKRWRAFCADNRPLIERVGVPLTVLASQGHFEDLLMHGYLDHYEDPARFVVDELDAERYGRFEELVDRYFAAGYHDPGLMVLSHEERAALARKYPAQFGGPAQE